MSETASPLSAEAPMSAAGAPPASQGDIRPMKPLWSWLRGLIITNTVLSLLVAAGLVVTISLTEAARRGAAIYSSDLMLAWSIFGAGAALIALAGTVIGLWSGFLWLKFIYRGMKNLREAGVPGARMSPAMAIGSYFIPIFSLWMPLQALRQIWRSSHAPYAPETVTVPPRIGLWWGLVLIASFLSLSGLVLNLSSPEEAAQTINLLNLLALLLSIPQMLLSLWFMSRIASGQDARLVAMRTF